MNLKFQPHLFGDPIIIQVSKNFQGIRTIVKSITNQYIFWPDGHGNGGVSGSQGARWNTYGWPESPEHFHPLVEGVAHSLKKTNKKGWFMMTTSNQFFSVFVRVMIMSQVYYIPAFVPLRETGGWIWIFIISCTHFSQSWNTCRYSAASYIKHVEMLWPLVIIAFFCENIGLVFTAGQWEHILQWLLIDLALKFWCAKCIFSSFWLEALMVYLPTFTIKINQM